MGELYEVCLAFSRLYFFRTRRIGRVLAHLADYTVHFSNAFLFCKGVGSDAPVAAFNKAVSKSCKAI